MYDAIIGIRIDSIIRFFLYIFIFWLPYSPAVIETCVIICLILWFLKRTITEGGENKIHGRWDRRLLAGFKQFNPATTFLNKPIFFFLAVCSFSSSTSIFWQQSLSNFLTKTLEWFIVYFLVVETVTERKHVYIILWLFFFTLCATVLDSLIQYYFTYKDIFLGHAIEPGTPATAGFKTPNGLGAYLALAIPLILAWILRKRGGRYRLLGALIFFLALWSLAVTFSRGAWLGTFLGVVSVVLILAFYQERLKSYFAMVFVLVITVLYVYFGLVLIKSFDLESSVQYSTVGWRLDLWGDGIRMIKERPFFGHGINTFMQLFEVYRRDKWTNPTYAHNCYIQLTAETGIVGLFGFLWIIFSVFRKTLYNINFRWGRGEDLTWLALGLLAGISAFLIHSFFDTNFYSLQLSVYFWFMIGVLMAIYQLKGGSCPSVNAH